MASLPVVNAFARHWWVLLIRGILAVLFGIMAFALPGLTRVTLVLLYGVYTLADGLTAPWVGGSARAWSLVFGGVLGVIVDIYNLYLSRHHRHRVALPHRGVGYRPGYLRDGYRDTVA
jgi:uncharacterized membrane protein HdeD (DUF308 family)